MMDRFLNELEAYYDRSDLRDHCAIKKMRGEDQSMVLFRAEKYA